MAAPLRRFALLAVLLAPLLVFATAQ